MHIILLNCIWFAKQFTRTYNIGTGKVILGLLLIYYIQLMHI